MRERTSDVPMRLLRAPEYGAVRSYTTKRGGTFILSRLMVTSHSLDGAWRLTHQPSGAVSPVRSYAEGIALIRRLQSAPAENEGAAQRFVILPRAEPMGGVVLFDRATGRWFPRSSEQPVLPGELDAMALLQPSAGANAGTVADWQMELALTPTPVSRSLGAAKAPPVRVATATVAIHRARRSR